MAKDFLVDDVLRYMYDLKDLCSNWNIPEKLGGQNYGYRCPRCLRR